MQKAVIVGGGFAGIRAALDLSKCKNVEATLVSDKAHFENHSTLYGVVTGNSLFQACIPLRDIFENTSVRVVEDRITDFDFTLKTAYGVSGKYSYDYLVLALGSETAYFDIPGLKELSHGMKSVSEALRLKAHLHRVFSTCDPKDAICHAHIVVVGGGASGVELAGQLVHYGRQLASKHGTDPSYVTVDLIEAAPRLLPALPEDVSERVQKHLRHIGVNIFLNRALEKETIEGVYLKDMKMKAETVIWTAGVAPNKLFRDTPAFLKDKRGRVLVNEYMEAKGMTNVFVLGDGASTPYTGMAQTALYDGAYAAKVIGARSEGKTAEAYVPKPVAYAIPVGRNWGAAIWHGFRFYGVLGAVLRRGADLRFFLSILPWRKAISTFWNQKTTCESCSICLPETA